MNIFPPFFNFHFLLLFLPSLFLYELLFPLRIFVLVLSCVVALFLPAPSLPHSFFPF